MRYPERRGRVISRAVRGTARLAFASFWQKIGRMAITTCGHAGRDQNGRAVARVSARPMLAPFSRENGSGSKSSYGAFIAARTTLRIGMPTHLRTRGRMRTETH